MLKEVYKEPFLGFTKESLNFLRNLKSPEFNNKKWFDKNRDIYEIYIKQPMRSLIDTLSGELKRIDGELVINYKSIFRINRDIRFSKDKTPYKSHYAASFCFGGIKKSDIPQFYFHFSPDEFLFAGGQYSMEPTKLKRIRKKIFDEYEIFRDITSQKIFLREYKKVEGETLTRLPKEYEILKFKTSDRQLLNFLKMKQFYVYKTYTPDVVLYTELTDIIKHNTNLTYDFVKFLNEAII